VVDITDRTFRFGVEIVKFTSDLGGKLIRFPISNQLIRSGTSVGANVEEAQNCGSKKEFIRSMTIALKEARETRYWLRIIVESGLLQGEKVSAVLEENTEIIKILTVIVKRSKINSTF